MTHFIARHSACALVSWILLASVPVVAQDKPESKIVYAHCEAPKPQQSMVKQAAWQNDASASSIQELIPLIPGGARRLAAPRQLTAQSRDGEQFVPLPKPAIDAPVDLSGTSGSVSLSASGADLAAVLKLIADEHHLNLVLGPGVSGPITVSIADAVLDEVLDAILAVGGFVWHRNGNLLYVTRLMEDSQLDPRVQGREVRVFPLNYVSASEVERVVVGLLSPAGKAFISESLETDQRRTQELLVVEDVPSGVSRIESYLMQIDHPPKQVLIEAHVLNVDLDDELRHGVNLQALADLSGASINFTTTGFANGESSSGATLGIDGSDLESVVEMIRTHNNARTLASPKVLVVNRQEARIQIGSQLGYYVTTTTQTGTFQSVEFLDTGVVLKVKPIISDTGEILMTVSPEVSGGRINALGLPEEETTEISSTILLPDGGGVVMGGLINEVDQDDHSMVPILGRIPKLGTLFRRHAKAARREEIIIALVTHIVPNVCETRRHEQAELFRTLPAHAVEELRHPGSIQ